MTRDELLARLVAIADERPFALIGYVVEHELPELRARAESINGAAQGQHNSSGQTGPAAAPPSAYVPGVGFLPTAQPSAQPVAWRDHVEHRLRSWQYEIMNEAGDRLGLDDFLDADELDSLIDFVCDEHAEPPDQTAAYRVCDCGHAESDHGPGLDSACQLCSCINPVYSPALPAQEPVAKVQNNSGIAWLPAGYNDLSIGPGALLYTAPPDLAARVKELEAVLRDAVTLVSIINQSEIVRSGYSLSLERAFRAALAKEKT